MKEPQIFQHEGHEIIFLDYSNLKKQEDIIKLVDDGSRLIRRKPFNSVLSLVNVENMYFNNTIRNYLQDNVKENTPHVHKTAVFGLNGLISIMFNSFLAVTGRNVKSFKTKEEALEYLIK